MVRIGEISGASWDNSVNMSGREGGNAVPSSSKYIKYIALFIYIFCLHFKLIFK